MCINFYTQIPTSVPEMFGIETEMGKILHDSFGKDKIYFRHAELVSTSLHYDERTDAERSSA